MSSSCPECGNTLKDANGQCLTCSRKGTQAPREVSVAEPVSMAQPAPSESPPHNPYHAVVVPDEQRSKPGRQLVEGSPSHYSIGRRFAAAQVDIGVSFILGVIAAKQIDDSQRPWQVAAFVGVVFGYYFLPEAILHATLGKLLFNLRVRQLDGRPCSWSQSLVRNILRVEVYTIGLISSICVVVTRRHQRLGDLAAKTVVVSID